MTYSNNVSQTTKGKIKMYSLKYWNNENSKPKFRKNIPYALAYALATRAGYAKAQVISEQGIVEYETRWETSGWDN